MRILPGCDLYNKKALILLFLILNADGVTSQPQVVSVSPAPNSLNIVSNVSITIAFNEDMDALSINGNTIRILGNYTDAYTLSTMDYESSTRTVTIRTAQAFKPGEGVNVLLTGEIKNSSGVPLSPIFSWAFTIAASPGPLNFIETSAVNTGNQPLALKSMDWDSDGFVDLIVANLQGPGLLSILKNSGQGTFTPFSEIDLSGIPISFTVGDWNDDAKLDIAVAGGESDKVIVLTNLGGGEFTQSSIEPTGLRPWAITHADFDFDGDLDLATFLLNNNFNGVVSILFNDGEGTFTETNVLAGGSTAKSIVPSDIDSDGDIDLIVPNQDSDEISILRNDGKGRFNERQRINTGSLSQPQDILANDFNGDGFVDLAVAVLNSPGPVAILLNDQHGGFVLQNSFGFRDFLSFMSTGDWDGDGDLDIAVVYDHANIVSILRNNGNGIFSPVTIVKTAQDPQAVATGDWDGDGDLDIAVSIYDADVVSIFLNAVEADFVKATTSFQNALNVKSATDVTFTFSDAIDETTIDSTSVSVYGNQTGFYPKNLTYNALQRTLAIRTQRDYPAGEVISVSITSMIKSAVGKPVVPFQTRFTAAASGGTSKFVKANGAKDIEVGDGPEAIVNGYFNNDHYLDLAVASRTSDRISILFNAGDGTFSESIELTVQDGPKALTAGDWDSNGIMDLAVGNEFSDDVAIFLQEDTSNYTMTKIAVGEDPTSITSGDWDFDGDLDLAVTAQSSHRVYILMNNGRGQFSNTKALGFFLFPEWVVSGDLDNDGDLDLVIANDNTVQSISYLENDGKGNFVIQEPLLQIGEPNVITIGDWNADSHLDLASVEGFLGLLTVLRNDGRADFRFTLTERRGDLQSPYCIANGDLDADGDLDVVTSSLYGNKAIIHLNNGSGEFAASNTLDLPCGLHSFSLGDYDNDKDLDLALLLQTSSSTNPAGKVSIFLNGNKPTSTVDDLHKQPKKFELAQNYPNPFNPTTTISYSLANSEFVTLKVYDIMGGEVQTLVKEFKKGGTYSVNFDANKLAAGVYFYEMRAGKSFHKIEKMILLK